MPAKTEIARLRPLPLLRSCVHHSALAPHLAAARGPASTGTNGAHPSEKTQAIGYNITVKVETARETWQKRDSEAIVGQTQQSGRELLNQCVTFT
ncbi:hypothetical protein J6590_051152 [Homalodisca vitripennis]|nr:hypothetical protein J6590_051152 [Homalodisca vitripennis]